jgi:uncharacterized membrane protein YdjX (TVP38/TMEM64 family)
VHDPKPRTAAPEPLPTDHAPPLGILDALMLLVVAMVGVGGYFLLRRLDAAAPLLVQRPVLGVVVYALACLAILYLLIRWGHKHRAVVRTLGPAGPLAVLSATMPAIGGFFLLGSLGVLGPWLADRNGLGLAIYVAGFMLFAGCALLPTYAQAILGGWAFKFALGFPAALAGFAGASLIGYAIGAKASGDRIVELIHTKPKWRAVRDALAGGGFWKTLGLVTLLRLPPNSPFAITNLVMASVRVPLAPYLIGTVVGMAPRTGVAVWIAAQVQGVLSEEGPDKPRWLVGAGIALTIVVVVVIGHIANKAIERVTAQPPADAPAEAT